jgi:predicted NAD/FAD-dependent oxidoreductase
MGGARAEGSESSDDWDLALPAAGPLACVMRSDARPGRLRIPEQAHWVAHARTGWSRRHLEHPAAWVQKYMQDALSEVLGHSVDWQHCVVHRWRYASPQAPCRHPVELCWWDASQALGVCADSLGGLGIEAAWMSAQAVCDALRGRATSSQAPSLSAVSSEWRQV